jgi:hypothetical protein
VTRLQDPVVTAVGGVSHHVTDLPCQGIKTQRFLSPNLKDLADLQLRNDR